MNTNAKKAPNPTDAHVGRRIRMRRMILGMSQEKLADGVKLTFQQIQKYEKGINRVGASRLQQYSEILGDPVSFFFDGAPTAAINGDRRKPLPGGSELIDRFLTTPGGATLAKAFVEMDPAVRHELVYLAGAIVGRRAKAAAA